MSDLKEILYNGIAGYENLIDVNSCLSYLEYYTLLGDYKDCKERLEDCKTALIDLYDRAMKNVKEANNLGQVLEAARILQKIRDAENKNGLPGEVISNRKILQQIDRAMIIAANRGEKLAKKKERRKRRRKILIAAAAAVLFITVLFGTYYHNEVIPPKTLEKAEQQYAAGEYEEALSTFGSLSDWKEWKDEAEEGLRKTHLALADRYMDERDFIAAFPHYHSAGEYEKELDARRTAAEVCTKKQEYEEAVRQYEELEKAEKEYLSKLRSNENWEDDPSTALKVSSLTADMEATKQNLEKVRILWAEELEEDGMTFEAIRQLKRVSRTPEISEKLKDLNMDLAEYQIGRVKNYSEPNAEDAGSLGRTIEEIDAQLHYCDALVSLGYDLAEVYPEGVQIDGTDLGLRDYNAEGPEAEPKEGRTLVLYRREHSRYYSNNYIYSIISDILGEQKMAASDYLYYLYPDLLYRLPEEKRASSWEDCDTLLLASSNYSFCEKVSGRWGSNDRTDYSFGLTSTYDTYSCTDKISVFQKEYPYFHVTVREKINEPSLKDGFNIAETGVMNIDELRLGKPDTEWIRTTLEKAVGDFGGEVRA